jgi:hypothetical protein
MTAALWFIVSNYLINEILEREWQTTAQIVRADVRQFLADEDFTAGTAYRSLINSIISCGT